MLPNSWDVTGPHRGSMGTSQGSPGSKKGVLPQALTQIPWGQLSGLSAQRNTEVTRNPRGSMGISQGSPGCSRALMSPPVTQAPSGHLSLLQWQLQTKAPRAARPLSHEGHRGPLAFSTPSHRQEPGAAASKASLTLSLVSVTLSSRT